jgi:Uncharacterized protein conserved in bacteria containing a pentein-type domain
MQTTNTVLMVRPVAFSYNAQTALNNAFQQKGIPEDESQKEALKEFDSYVVMLKEAGINVLVVEDTLTPHTPDSIFPNNWFSTHNDKTVGSKRMVLYPMFAQNRRMERKQGVFEAIKHFDNNEQREVIDLTKYENDNKFLEGTGSMILDRENKIIYACSSIRTNEDVLDDLADKLGYKYFLFEANDSNGAPIYHTNVMMCVGTAYAIVCLDSITNIDEREHLIELIEESGKDIIEISLEQMYEFAGNMLELKDKEGNPVLIMSARAKASLDNDQLERLNSYYKIISPDLEFIEKNGGGSARCMLAEIF